MGSRTVLLVDDSPLTLEVTRRALEGAGYATRVARDLEEIERVRGAGPLDLILMDVEMAEAFGDDIASLLRGSGDRVPIYLLSALAEDELADRAAEAGIDGYLSKRAGVVAVVRRVAVALGDQAPQPPRGLRSDFMSLFVETARRRARHARAALQVGSLDALRQAAFELHALIGEASVLGFTEIADLAQLGRTSAEKSMHAPDADGMAHCAELLATLDQRVDALGRELPATGGLAPTRLTRPGMGELVMLVDDSDIYRATLRAIMEEAGYSVTEAASLAECRELLPTTACDLAVLDVELGDGDGTTLIADVRSTQPAAAIVVMTGGDGRTLPKGADLVLLKTLDPTSVLVKLERLLADRRAHA